MRSTFRIWNGATREPGLRTIGKIVAAPDTTLLAILKGL